jgi:hypothetical protein
MCFDSRHTRAGITVAVPGPLTRNAARRIAVNIVKQPELLSDVGVCRFHFDLNQIAELPESATEARSRLGDNAMSSAAGFPHSVAVALGLFSFALSLLVLVAFGGLSLF